MKFVFVSLMLLAGSALAQENALTETLPNGKVVHFVDADQKQKFDAAQTGLALSAVNSAKTADEQLVEWNQATRSAGDATVDAVSRPLWFKVLEVRAEGVMAVVAFAKFGRTFVQVEPPKPSEYSTTPVYLRCDASAGFVHGMTFQAWAYRDGTHHQKMTGGAVKYMMRLCLNGQIRDPASPQPTPAKVHFGDTMLDHP